MRSSTISMSLCTPRIWYSLAHVSLKPSGGLGGENVLTQPRIIVRFRSDLVVVQSLITRHLIYCNCKRSRSRGQRSRSQHNVPTKILYVYLPVANRVFNNIRLVSQLLVRRGIPMSKNTSVLKVTPL